MEKREAMTHKYPTAGRLVEIASKGNPALRRESPRTNEGNRKQRRKAKTLLR